MNVAVLAEVRVEHGAAHDYVELSVEQFHHTLIILVVIADRLESFFFSLSIAI